MISTSEAHYYLIMMIKHMFNKQKLNFKTSNMKIINDIKTDYKAK